MTAKTISSDSNLSSTLMRDLTAGREDIETYRTGSFASGAAAEVSRWGFASYVAPLKDALGTYSTAADALLAGYADYLWDLEVRVEAVADEVAKTEQRAVDALNQIGRGL